MKKTFKTFSLLVSILTFIYCGGEVDERTSDDKGASGDETTSSSSTFTSLSIDSLGMVRFGCDFYGNGEWERWEEEEGGINRTTGSLSEEKLTQLEEAIVQANLPEQEDISFTEEGCMDGGAYQVEFIASDGTTSDVHISICGDSSVIPENLSLLLDLAWGFCMTF